MYTLEGVNSVANFITAYEESHKNRDSHFLIHSVFFVSKGNIFYVKLYFLLFGLLPSQSLTITSELSIFSISN